MKPKSSVTSDGRHAHSMDHVPCGRGPDKESEIVGSLATMGTPGAW
ncbi:MAG: hypothetical protein ACJAUC_004007, partial [Planctomycetota bacterium]